MIQKLQSHLMSDETAKHIVNALTNLEGVNNPYGITDGTSTCCIALER